MLVLLQVFRWVTMGFLRVGHTHDKIDQLFAQVATAIKDSTFDTPTHVIEVLERLCRRNEESGATIRAEAHRLGETACWKSWVEQACLDIEGHTGKGLHLQF